MWRTWDSGSMPWIRWSRRAAATGSGRRATCTGRIMRARCRRSRGCWVSSPSIPKIFGLSPRPIPMWNWRMLASPRNSLGTCCRGRRDDLWRGVWKPSRWTLARQNSRPVNWRRSPPAWSPCRIRIWGERWMSWRRTGPGITRQSTCKKERPSRGT